jgi:hypothetical protein
LDKSLIDLVVDRVVEEYFDEAKYYHDQLGLTKNEWESWKNGKAALPDFAQQQLIFLFSDYEWMLVQKVLRITRMAPEKENQAVSEYRLLRAKIAKKWLNADLATIKLVEKVDNEQDLEKQIQVKVEINYDVWGYSDVITFTFPAVDRPRITGSKRELIQLMTDNYE